MMKAAEERWRTERLELPESPESASSLRKGEMVVFSR